MIVDELLTQLNDSGINIRLKEDSDLTFTAPKSAMNAEIAGQIKYYKNETVAFLNNGSSAENTAWQHDWLSSQAAATDLHFWNENLQSPVEALILPVSQIANNNQSFYEVPEKQYTISAKLTFQKKDEP